MPTPTADTYTAASGATLQGGRGTPPVTPGSPTWIPTTAWQWTDVPGTTWNNYIKDDGTGASGAPAVTLADPGPDRSYMSCWSYSGPAYSVKNHEFWMFGGGHAGTTINILTRYNLNKNTPDVSMVSAPTTEAHRSSWNLSGGAAASVTPFYPLDGKPYCGHSYANNMYSDLTDEFIIFRISGIATSGDGGGSMSGGPASWNEVAAYTRGVAWRAAGSYANIPTLQDSAFLDYCPKAINASGSATYYWPLGQTPRKFTYATNTYSNFTGGTASSSLTSRVGINGDETYALFLAGSAGWDAYVYSLTTGVRSAITMSGYTPTAGLQCWGVEWVADLGCYVAVFVTAGAINGAGGGVISGTAVVKIQMTSTTTATATLMTMTGSAPTQCNAIKGMAYDPVYQCLLLVMGHSTPIKAIKVA